MHHQWLSDNGRERLNKINSFLLFDRKLTFLQQQQLLSDRLSIIVHLKGSEALLAPKYMYRCLGNVTHTSFSPTRTIVGLQILFRQNKILWDAEGEEIELILKSVSLSLKWLSNRHLPLHLRWSS